MLGEKIRMDKVSIVTVSYNAEQTIRNTIQSVLDQTYINYEYVVIDGKSSDNTCSIIESYKSKFQEKGIRFHILSEPDEGIYDAMNKAVSYCTGQWIIYMNANDRFANKDVLLNIFYEKKYDVDCIYGDTWNVLEEQKYYKKSYPIKTIYYRGPFIHQALFTRLDVIKRYPFNLEYSISAEYDQFLRMYIDGCKFIQIKEVVAEFRLDGVSQINSKEAQKQRVLIKKRNGVYFKKFFRRFFYEKIVFRLKKIKWIRRMYINFLKWNV